MLVFSDEWMGGQPWRAEVRCFATFIPSMKGPFSPGPSETPSANCERLGLSASEDAFATQAPEDLCVSIDALVPYSMLRVAAAAPGACEAKRPCIMFYK
jgi:hypothetical protein